MKPVLVGSGQDDVDVNAEETNVHVTNQTNKVHIL